MRKQIDGLCVLVWLEIQTPVRGSKFAAAVNYALNRWDVMITYLENGRWTMQSQQQPE